MMQNKPTHKSTRERVIEILADKLVQPAESFEPFQSLKEDLGIDSLDFTELLIELEDEFDKEFDEVTASKCLFVHDLIMLCGGPNANTRGLRCPDCGSDQNLAIEGRAIFTLRGDFSEAPGEIEFSDEGYATCPSCEWEGEYQELRPKN